MIRVLLVLLGVLVAVLAFVLDRPLLYAAAGVALVTALALAARRFLRKRQPQHRAGRGSDDREEPMESLGIMEVRPQARSDDAAASAQDESAPNEAVAGEPTSDPARPRSGSQRPAKAAGSDRAQETPGAPEAVDATTSRSESTEDADTEPVASNQPETAAAEREEDGDAADDDEFPVDPEASESPSPNGSVDSEAESSRDESRPYGVTTTPVDHDPILVPYVESIRAALNAQSVCVLVQEDVLLDYEIRAIASTEADVQQSGSFSTREPLLTAKMTQQSVTIRPLDGEGAVDEYLKYYRSPVQVDHIALAPVPRPNEPSTCFLLADTSGSTSLDTTEARTLLEHFAETLGLILQADHSVVASGASGDRQDSVPRSTDENGSMDEPATTTASEAAAAERAHAAEIADETPRPRREIVAEEMVAADDEQAPLALVLVHLNRAEVLAQEGDDVVAAGERKLRGRLEDAAPGSRVTRFGELTYGVFFRGEADAVEPWAIDLQHEMADEAGILEGGVSIGVAMRADRHDGRPEALRTDATEALRQAYESGAATIIE